MQNLCVLEPLAFIYYDELVPGVKRFVTEDFSTQLPQMGCPYATREDFACGETVSDCVDYVIKHCSLFFMFPLPNIDSMPDGKYIQDRLVHHSMSSKPQGKESDHEPPALIPIRLPGYEELPSCYEHLTAVTFDIHEPDSERNQHAYRHIWHRVEQLKNQRQNATNEHVIEHPVRNRRNKRKKAKKANTKERREDDTRNAGKTVELMTSACSVARHLTNRWILMFVVLLLIADFVREFLLIPEDLLQETTSEDGNISSQHVVSAVTFLLSSIVCRFLAGIASMWCLNRQACKIQQLNLKAVLQRDDIHSIKVYLLKEGILRHSARDVKDEEVVNALQTYLRSTDWLFLVFPWVHCGVLVLLSILGSFYDKHFHTENGNSDYTVASQLIPQFVHSLATFVVLGFCHSAASYYQIQNKLLVDIHKVFTSSETKQSHVSPSLGVITAWNKLRNEVEHSVTLAFSIGIIGVVLRVVMLLISITEKPSILAVTAVQYFIHIYLLVSEGMSNCPSRSMKAAGLGLDGVLLLVVAKAMSMPEYWCFCIREHAIPSSLLQAALRTVPSCSFD